MPTTEEIINLAELSSVRLVRFLYCDTSSVIRGKTTHVNGLKDRLETGIGLVKGMMAMNLLDQLQADTGLGATGEVRLVPDLSTFKLLPYDSGSALLLCDLLELDRRPWALCPRSILKRQIKAAEQIGLSFLAAFEPEFLLGSNVDGAFKPIDEGLCFSTESMNRASKFINSFVDGLQKQEIEVEQYYPELGAGQHELSISHGPALLAADRHIVYRETLRGVANEQGLQAMLTPKPFPDQPGNGCHLHLSMWDEKDSNVFFSQDGLSAMGRSFVAGLLAHLPALVAITCPSVNSYRRLQPKSWSSAYVCWGFENREAAVRVPSTYWGKEQSSTNIEIKCVDGSCNPYLALAAIIAAGLDGIERKLTPPQPVSQEPSELSEKDQQSHQIRRLPTSLKEALTELERDTLLKDSLGQELIRVFLTVKYSECAAFAGKNTEFELLHHRTKF